MARLLSVNVGLPRDIQWLGRTVRTAIFKEPVAGRVFASRLNLAGDGQADLAGHGGEQRAVMVYQLESYRYWENYLQRPDLRYGHFGENLTVEGLADTEVCVGDRFRIGSAIFEASQPRVTCYKVGLRLNHPQMPSLMVAHRRPGFYFRVIQEGEVGAGDPIEKIAEGPESLTVADIDSLLYSSEHPVEMLQRALRVSALSPGWKASFQALLGAAGKGSISGNPGLSAPMAPLSWAGFKALRVIASKQESEGVRSFEFAAADGSSLPSWIAGQHIALKLHPGSLSPAVLRMYSLCGAPDTGTFRIAVKNEGGIGSRYVTEQLQVGDLVEASAPRGTFTLEPGATPVVLLSAGIGITPILAMLYSIARADEDSSREVWWIHSARNGAQHSFANEGRQLIKRLKHASVCNLYTSPTLQDRLGTDYDLSGRLDTSLLRQLRVPADADFYLCGPPGFLANARAMLKSLRADSLKVHTEIFGPVPPLQPGVVSSSVPRPHLPEGNQGAGPAVTFIRSGLTAKWDARFKSVLELAEACSVPVRWSCRTGVCHNCESGLVDGTLRYAPEPLDPPAAGTALICCAQPTSDLQLDL